MRTRPEEHRRMAAQRGAATVEFALVVPLLITMVMFSMFLTEIVRVKMKLQEASRFVAWEFTSYMLTDYGNKDHAARWDQAHTEILEQASERYKNLDSVEDNAPFSAIFDLEELQVTVQDQEVPFIQDDIPGLGSGGGIPGASAVLNQFNGALSSVLGFWGFNPKGQVQADVRMKVNNKYLPQNYLNGGDGFFQVDQWGGVDLSSFTMNSRLTMVANAWNLTDGADAVHKLGSTRSTGKYKNSNENHGMFEQVKRMTFLGLNEALPDFGEELMSILPINPLASYLVSHNYKKATRAGMSNCGLPKHMGANNGESGLVNLQADPSNILDEGPQRCFDTSPFRDTHAYEDSHYRTIFQARGEWFMGCKNDQADDPTRSAPHGSDEQAQKRGCGT